MKKLISAVVSTAVCMSLIAPAANAEESAQDRGVSGKGIDSVVKMSDQLFRDKGDKTQTVDKNDSKDIREFLTGLSSDLGSSDDESQSMSALFIVAVFAGLAAYRGMMFTAANHR